MYCKENLMYIREKKCLNAEEYNELAIKNIIYKETVL